MIDAPDKRFRRLSYLLTDVESSLHAAGRPVAAETIRVVTGRFGESSASGFLEECRTALESILLGERGLSVEIIGQLMDVLADIDETLRGKY